ncbi:hypothetical protein Syun_027701 [Stephania yunnanensis]|uniref:Uncharacterized protein n=1 Tax=Stephania yunnanensis TaxID=152371 RepID=A0AAP0HRH8_9MAGN
MTETSATRRRDQRDGETRDTRETNGIRDGETRVESKEGDRFGGFGRDDRTGFGDFWGGDETIERDEFWGGDDRSDLGRVCVDYEAEENKTRGE